LAIDTVKIESVSISESVANIIENVSMQRIGIDNKTQSMMYCLTSADLKGSFDNRISVQVKRERFVTRKDQYESDAKNLNAKVSTSKEQCPPYVVIEASVHKIFLGHNIYGGTENFVDACNYLVYIVEQVLEIELPLADDWIVSRVDFAYGFDLSSIEAVQEFFYLMKNSTYPRRGSPSFFGNHGLSISATTTILKAYNKGVEFTKHDFKKLKVLNIFPTERLWELAQIGNSILRFEVGIRPKKLRYDFQKGVEDANGKLIRRYGELPCVKHISTAYLKKVYESEVYKLMKEGREENTKTKNSMEVRNRLMRDHSPRMSNILFSAWLTISQFGIDFYKESVSRTQYFGYTKKLRESGISILLTDMKDFTEINGQTTSKIPDDFQPIEKDIRRVIGTDPLVYEAIERMKQDKREKKIQRENAV
jgi:II/X family phage/plasmid replication protein